jgi:hypothetical protein
MTSIELHIASLSGKQIKASVKEVYVETEEGFVPYKHYLPQEVTMALIYWEEKGIERLEDEKWKDYELKKLEEENKWITEIQDDEEE